MRTRGFPLLAILLAPLALSACGDSAKKSGGGTGGAGAPSGTGGTTPAGTGGIAAGTGGATPTGTGGTTSDAAPVDSASACKVPCLATLDSECLPSGACTEQAVGPLGIATNRCYDNGVKILSDVMIGLPNSTLKITHKKADGSVCFTVEGTLNGATAATVTWKDPAGNAVATGTYAFTTMAATIMCGGQTFDAQAAASCGALRNLPRAPGSPSTGGCSMGSCM
jgi:hypothetical protein